MSRAPFAPQSGRASAVSSAVLSPQARVDEAVAQIEVVVVEDSANGLRAALGAGLRTVVTVSSYTADEDFTGASLVVSSLGDLPDDPATVLDDPLGLDIPPDQLDDARRVFEDTEWNLETLIKFDVVDDLTVEAAPDTTDDRTDEWLAFLEAGGF